jgi:hypothetical protein
MTKQLSCSHCTTDPRRPMITPHTWRREQPHRGGGYAQVYACERCGESRTYGLDEKPSGLNIRGMRGREWN